LLILILLTVFIYYNFSDLFSETNICGIRFKTSSITERHTYVIIILKKASLLNITNNQRIPVSPCSMVAFTPSRNKESTPISNESKPWKEHFLTHGLYT
jgi:hypothetical protein